MEVAFPSGAGRLMHSVGSRVHPWAKRTSLVTTTAMRCCALPPPPQAAFTMQPSAPRGRCRRVGRAAGLISRAVARMGYIMGLFRVFSKNYATRGSCLISGAPRRGSLCITKMEPTHTEHTLPTFVLTKRAQRRWSARTLYTPLSMGPGGSRASWRRLARRAALREVLQWVIAAAAAHV